ncbi:OsmC family protein [Nitriliruptoraceae bacterium ZYF776]|nr:OsmC family protein [Profundirhabdus halotolerans]
MAGDEHRRITLDRVDEGVYRATNPRGGELVFGTKAGEGFTPVELLLAAIGGCSAVDVDVVTGRHADHERFEVEVDGEVVRDETGNVLRDLEVTFRVAFPEGPAGDKARQLLPRAVRTSHDRTCTVSRTIEAGVPVAIRVADG